MRVRDHALVRMRGGARAVQSIVALPDSSRFTFLSLTGTHCTLSDIRVDQEEAPVAADEIPRIAEEISYIRGCPEGDVPNLQVDGWRAAATAGIPIRGDMTLSFHTQSLPTARLVWHCPFVTLFTSEDGAVNGPGFREYLLLRLDGENRDSDDHADNQVQIQHSPTSWAGTPGRRSTARAWTAGSPSGGRAAASPATPKTRASPSPP